MNPKNQNKIFVGIFICLLLFVVFSFFKSGNNGEVGLNSEPEDKDKSEQSKIEDELKENKPELDFSAMRGLVSGELFGWGVNNYGQIGLDPATYTLVDSATKVENIGISKKVVSGYYHSVSLSEDGKVYTWGLNNFGQLGRETDKGYDFVPREISFSKKVVDIDADLNATIILDEDGEVWTFGSNFTGQMGKTDAESVHQPAKISGLPKISSVSAGYRFMMATDEGGELWAWGAKCNSDNMARLNSIIGSLTGDLSSLGGYVDPAGDSFEARVEEVDCINEEVIGIQSREPIKIGKVQGVVKATAGYGHMLILQDDGKVLSLGCNAFGQLGLRDTKNSNKNNVAREVSGLENIVDVDAGFRHSLALNNEGEVFAWGHNKRGQVGQGELSLDIDKPTKVKFEDGVKIEKIFAGHDFSFAIDVEGKVYAWGDTLYGHLFFSPDHEKSYESIYVTKPTLIPLSTKVVSVSVGGNYVIVNTEVN